MSSYYSKNYYSIGELARYQNISKQTLIYYDRIGLFKPAYVDPDTGYRYYSPKQIDYLDTILVMKKIGFSLEEIGGHMRHYNLENSSQILQKQLRVIDDRIRELQLIRNRVQHRCVSMEEALKYRINPIVVEKAPRRFILWHEVERPYSLEEISIATKKCFADAEEQRLPIFFQTGVIVPASHIEQERYTEATVAFLPVEYNTKVENLMELPQGTSVGIYHFGTYESIGRSYRRLIEYCEKEGLKRISDSYEFCINDYITSGDETEYITKIMFYIQEESPCGREENMV